MWFLYGDLEFDKKHSGQALRVMSGSMWIAPPVSCAELLTKLTFGLPVRCMIDEYRAIAPPLIPELLTKEMVPESVMVLL